MKRKKIMMVVLVVFAMLFGGKSLLWAQKSYEEKAQRITEHMVKKLDLSQEQKEKVYAINLKKAEAYKSLKNTKDTTSREERKKQFKMKIDAWKNELKTVLNEEQFKKIRIK
jgi:hypothetical protein